VAECKAETPRRLVAGGECLAWERLDV